MKVAYSLLLMLLFSMSSWAQYVSALSQLNPSKKYLLENANGYGYAVYNPDISDRDVMLAGIQVPHSMGVANALYYNEVNAFDPNCQWKIEANGGKFCLYNLGAKRYMTNLTTSWNWWGESADFGSFYFTENKADFDIYDMGEGQWAFRLTQAADAFNADQKFLCAASHSGAPMAAWTADDAGSAWYIKEVIENFAESIKLNTTNLTLTEGEAFTLRATVTPSNVPGANLIVWETDNTKVATVEDGVVIAKNKGTCTITAKVNDGSGLVATCTVTVKEPEIEELGTLRYFTLADGQLIVIPEKYIEGRSEENGIVTITLSGDTTFCYTKGKLVCEDTAYNGSLPQFESFKFNNKFNDQLYADADGVIDHEAGKIDATVSCIGKRLTPSFKLPEGAKAYVGRIEQLSRVTRRRFEKDVTYTVAYPNNWIYRIDKVSNEVWSTPDDINTVEQWITTEVPLTESMLSSNWASQEDDQKLGNLLDDNLGTCFHSNWSSSNNWHEGSYYGDGETIWPYLQIELQEAIRYFKFSYITRDWEQNNGYAPQGFIIMGSQDGSTWDELTTLDKEKDNLPLGMSQEYTSANILLGQAYKYLRFQLTESARKNYLVLSEFKLYSLAENPDYGKDIDDFVPELIAPAVYRKGFMPFGHDYKVHVDFLTDHPTGKFAEYNVPRIDITFGDGQTWDYNNWIGRYGKDTWEDATIKIDGAGVFPDMEETQITVRGRGNSSWDQNYSSKNPYRIKFAEKVKPFGLTKGKNWVLLANKQSGSLTTNAIAMKIADMAESAACNHIIPVELYVNNQYRGSYNFTEKVGFANNSIDVDDEAKAVLLELDSYYDEPYRFHSDIFKEPVNIKAPDFDDPEQVTELTFDDIKDGFNLLCNATRDGEHASLLDVDAFCRAMLVTDLTRNTEVQHPKSWYVYNPDLLNDSAWVFGPVWDFDWSYGYEGRNQYFIYDAEVDLFNYDRTGIPFFRQLLRGSEVVKKHYYKVWTEFLRAGKFDELIEYCDDYFEYAEPSLLHNATQWGDGNSYKKTNNNAKQWLTKRINYIYSNLEVYDLSDDIIDEFEGDEMGQPDHIDIASVVNEPVDVYTLNGIKVRSRVPYINSMQGLIPGIYIVKGQKMIAR
ncbi:MAG: CotH kinase family protein [Bacteroidaceae bacterium]|nr:CotH kinase family protein [Bacteroidaceae bacterium]